jgi:hypothetical protein
MRALSRHLEGSKVMPHRSEDERLEKEKRGKGKNQNGEMGNSIPLQLVLFSANRYTI